MSGGSMDYICYKVDEAASKCEDAEMKDLLRDASKVLHDQEWWWSSDYSEEDYRETLAKFKAKWFSGDRSERLKGYVDESMDRLRGELYSLIGVSEAE